MFLDDLDDSTSKQINHTIESVNIVLSSMNAIRVMHINDIFNFMVNILQ